MESFEDMASRIEVEFWTSLDSNKVGSLDSNSLRLLIQDIDKAQELEAELEVIESNTSTIDRLKVRLAEYQELINTGKKRYDQDTGKVIDVVGMSECIRARIEELEEELHSVQVKRGLKESNLGNKVGITDSEKLAELLDTKCVRRLTDSEARQVRKLKARIREKGRF
jgi:hypothetical protein